MLPNRVLNRRPLTYESGSLPTALHGWATTMKKHSEDYYPISPMKHPQAVEFYQRVGVGGGYLGPKNSKSATTKIPLRNSIKVNGYSLRIYYFAFRLNRDQLVKERICS